MNLLITYAPGFLVKSIRHYLINVLELLKLDTVNTKKLRKGHTSILASI
jgi:hypothetical protein